MNLVGYFFLFLIFYSYVGYPVVLLILSTASIFFTKKREKVEVNGISIIITCRNEEKVLKDKLDNTLSLQFFGRTVAEELAKADSKVQVIVASDASDDRTNQIVDSYSSVGVYLVALTQRSGKEAAQKKALEYVRNNVILFTDAKIVLKGNVLENLLKYFQDPSVGAVSSKDLVIDEKGGSGEGAYVSYEMWLRRLESSIYSLIGLSGSCFAVRREVTFNFPEGVPSDFCTLLEARRLGLRGVHADDVLAAYKAVSSHEAEFERKVRTVVRGMRSVWSYRDLIFSISYPYLTFQILSHKIMRWLTPLFGIFVFIVSLMLVFESAFWLVVFAAASLVFGFAIQGYLDQSSRRNPVVRVCFFFCLSNMAILIAWWKFLFGDKHVMWNPSEKG